MLGWVFQARYVDYTNDLNGAPVDDEQEFVQTMFRSIPTRKDAMIQLGELLEQIGTHGNQPGSATSDQVSELLLFIHVFVIGTPYNYYFFKWANGWLNNCHQIVKLRGKL